MKKSPSLIGQNVLLFSHSFHTLWIKENHNQKDKKTNTMAHRAVKKSDEDLARLREELAKLEIARLKAFNDLLERKWYLYREELYNTHPEDPYAQWIDSCMAEAMNSIQTNIRVIICKENSLIAKLQPKRQRQESVGHFQDLATCPQVKRLATSYEERGDSDTESIDSSTPLGEN